MSLRPLLLASTIIASPAAAQTAAPTPPAVVTPDADDTPATGNAQRAHADDDETIVVTGVRRSGADVLGQSSVLDSEELMHDLKPNIGDTLADMPGVSSTSFGPSAGRPILRGETGERVRVLVDGIGSLDLSASDPDHAVAINPLTARSIELLRGPSALLYSSQAIAGVVNVIDTRIPRDAPAGGIGGDALLNLGSAANERSASGQLNAALGGGLIAHVDGAYSKYDDLHIGGHVLSDRLRDIAEASPDPEIRELVDLKGKIPNTAGRLDDIAAGLAYAAGGLNLGISVSHHDAKYGVPIRYSLDPDTEDEKPVIDAHQNRVDARAAVPLGGLFSSVDFRGGLSRYKHNELEPDGEVGSRFFSNGGEGRVDLIQRDRGGWGGTSGVQLLRQTARIEGEEKYLPDSNNRQVGLFTLQTYSAGRLRAEGAIRLDMVRVHADEDEVLAEEPDGDPRIGVEPLSRHFTPFSASVGANYDVGGDWRIGASLSHSERAPSIDELFSKGAHGGSQQFLVGNPDLKTERSNGIEVDLVHKAGPFNLQGSVYYSRYSSFIYQVPTGEINDGLPHYEYFQGKADYYGFDAEADVKFGRAMGIDWGGELVTDAVRAKIDDFSDAPEIPPFRILAGLTGSRGDVDGRVEIERVASQHKIAPEETPTAGYTMVNASLDWHPLVGQRAFTLSLTGNNLFDVNARRHSSDLKDYAPLAGRDIRLSARYSF